MTEPAPDPQVEALIEQYREARAEIARLTIPDDHGAGMRTARLAGLGAWQMEAERIRRRLEELTGRSWPPPDDPTPAT